MHGPEAVAVTGATGHVGRDVVLALSAHGTHVRASGLSVDAVRAMHGDHADCAQLDLLDEHTFAPAVAGCRSLFLVRPAALAEAPLAPFLDEAIRQGVCHIVFLSVAGAAESTLVPHHAVEELLEDEAARHTVLRPGFFAQNLGGAFREEIVNEGRLLIPAARGRVAFVDARDVAEVAAMVLEHPEEHEGKAYTLTGPEATSFEEVAELLTSILGRPIVYEPASVVGYIRRLHDRGLPLAQVAMQTLLHVGLRYGHAEEVNPTLERLLGRRGHTVERYVRDYQHLWSVPAPSSRRAYG